MYHFKKLINISILGLALLVPMQITAQQEEPRCDKVDVFIHTDPLAIPYPSIQPRLLKWAVPPIEMDPHDGTFVYDVCLTYYGMYGATPPPNPPCVESTSPGPVEFDVYAGYRFDVESSIRIEFDATTYYSGPSYCAIVTGGSDSNGDGYTSTIDFGLFIQQYYGPGHREPF
jgi:hypothetical protein